MNTTIHFIYNVINKQNIARLGVIAVIMSLVAIWSWTERHVHAGTTAIRPTSAIQPRVSTLRTAVRPFNRQRRTEPGILTHLSHPLQLGVALHPAQRRPHHIPDTHTGQPASDRSDVVRTAQHPRHTIGKLRRSRYHPRTFRFNVDFRVTLDNFD